MHLIETIRQRVFLMDGAMGTQIQAQSVPKEAWQGHLRAPPYERSAGAASPNVLRLSLKSDHLMFIFQS